jgi:type III restriction enzyme
LSTVNVDDLVLNVRKDVDPNKFNIDKYEDFLEALCPTRDFLRESIEETVRFFLSGQYKTTSELAKENFDQNQVMRDVYGSFQKLEDKLEFKDKLSCTLDLATATGKTWAMFGIAQIMLSEGVVDKVLVLCPSLTIENQLTTRFKEFSSNPNLKSALPDDAVIKNPRIIDASQTIRKGDVCIENIHATYSRTSSSIDDSLSDRGETTLIINDESHHIMNPKDEAGATDRKYVKKWKEFLADDKYNFHYIVNLSGTPYLGNSYASDVIYRYNIMDALNGKKASKFVIKKINYVDRETAVPENERLEIIYQNHQRNKKDYPKVKPITIFVTQRISGAETLTQKIKDFLQKKEKLSLEEVDKKAIVVTSSPKHEDNLRILKLVDDKTNKVEWIVSVSMLTEGWDVKNVFQIVPHEERAFNSKLLIAQVLGRGLRVPPAYENDQPTVIIYNHAKWSSAIQNLVLEVLSIEKRLRCYQVEKDHDYNFSLDQINYKKIEKTSKLKPKAKPIAIPKIPKLSSQPKNIVRDTTYQKFKEGKEETRHTTIHIESYTLDQLVNDIHTKLILFDEEEKTDYAKKFDKKKFRNDVKKALEEINEKTETLSPDNYNRILSSYNVLHRQISGTTIIEREFGKPFTVQTKDVGEESISISQLQKDNAMIYDKKSIAKSEPDHVKLFNEAVDESPGKNVIRVDNTFHFKNPFNTAFLSHGNEIEFARQLVDKRYTDHFDAWIKSPDRGFYGIPYVYQKGSHQKEAKFNPDFFIKIKNDILVIEIKSDADITEVNKAKSKHANIHFQELNDRKLKQKYHFKFLSPKDYTSFFDSIINDHYKDYVADLDAELLN